MTEGGSVAAMRRLAVAKSREGKMGLLEDKIALITGASSGIGRSTAGVFAREGAKVVAADVDADGGAATVEAIRSAGGEAAFVACDVSQAGEVAAAVDFAVETFGGLDCAHNNAGIDGPMGPAADYSEKDYDRVIAVNLKGVFLCMKYEIPRMLARGGGAIVNTASIAGLTGVRNLSPYVASKHGVNGLTKAVALEYAQAGIRVNSVCPGVIRTPMVDQIVAANPEMQDALTADTPVARIGEPEEIGQAVAWLCSDAASFVTGETLTVDGGYMAK